MLIVPSPRQTSAGTLCTSGTSRNIKIKFYRNTTELSKNMASLLRERTLESFRLFNLPIEQKWVPKRYLAEG